MLSLTLPVCDVKKNLSHLAVVSRLSKNFNRNNGAPVFCKTECEIMFYFSIEQFNLGRPVQKMRPVRGAPTISAGSSHDIVNQRTIKGSSFSKRMTKIHFAGRNAKLLVEFFPDIMHQARHPGLQGRAGSAQRPEKDPGEPQKNPRSCSRLISGSGQNPPD